MTDCRGELLLQVRNGLASAQERRCFEAHLSNCEACRMTIEIMGDFDAWGKVEPGDCERVARMAANTAALRGLPQRNLRRMPRRVWPLVLASLVIAGAAIAGTVINVGQGSPPAIRDSALKTDASGGTNTVPVGSIAPHDTVPASPSLPEPPSEKAVQAAKAATESSIEKNAAKAPSATTAAEMYRAANDARRAGQTKHAVQVYQSLQHKFAGSEEAHASRVSLGGLLLRSGASAAALAQFDSYLASGGGRLAAEALFGRAQALQALGRSADEAQNLERLVALFPQSAYATHAKRRLLLLR